MRRLSAIMFTDMVGYSALAQENEALSLELLEEHRKILRPIFKRHGGREIDTAGDSFFVEFKSAVESSHCAIEIQQTLFDRNLKETKERQIRLRIGLHIGDVVYLDKHVHGDGVNIAARLEPLALPGGICISEDVARQVTNKIPYPVVKLGAEKLKNISMPMEIYCIALPWLHNGKAKKKKRPPISKRLSWALVTAILVLAAAFFFYREKTSTEPMHSKHRLAVLPLSNISEDQKDEYFADGMTEELISCLSKIGGLNVIARTSIMKYKGSNKDIARIGNELMVGTILEGSVRKFENKARVTVQLIDVSSQEHLWSMDYDRELKDIFTIQSEIAQNVAHELKVRLVSFEKEQLEKGGTQNMEAYEEYLVGKYFLNQRTPESVQASLSHFEQSISDDSMFALPYASLAYAYTLIGVAGYGNIQRSVAEAQAKKAVMKALAIDETLAEGHAALGYIRFRIDWDWSGAEKELKRAIALKPNYATAHEWYALFLAIRERLDEALEEMQKAYALDPLSTSVSNGLARIYHFRNEPAKSLAQRNKTLQLDSNYAEAYFTAGMTYAKFERYDSAILELKRAIELSGRRPVILGVLGSVYAKSGRPDECNQLVRELQTGPQSNDKIYAVGLIKSNMGQADEAFAILNKLVDEKYGVLIYFKVEKGFFGYSHDPRFHQMLSKMGLE